MSNAHPGPAPGPAAADAPGANIRRLREAAGWSQRELAANCRPEIAPTTINRIERNRGYTLDSLDRIAAALRTTVEALLMPPELSYWGELTDEQRVRIARMIDDMVAANRGRGRL